MNRNQFSYLTLAEYNILENNYQKVQIERSKKAKQKLFDKYETFNSVVAVNQAKKIVENCLKNIGL